MYTPNSDEDHGGRESSSAFQDPHGACFPAG